MSNTVVISGANRGIGLELVKVFLKSDYDVIAGVRSLETATRLISATKGENCRIFALDCPPPEVHVAFAEKWHKLYGVSLIGMRRSELTFSVSKRPSTREEAERLAEEMYFYCPDIVEQGCDTLRALASILLISDHWYFWWD